MPVASYGSGQVWPRPVPTIGDATTAAERAADPSGWALSAADGAALENVVRARRDIRRFRADAVPDRLIRHILAAAHQAPSVGHSQPWRFVIVRDPETRIRAAVMADQARLAQAVLMDPESGRHLLDLDLEGIREAPVGVVVCCDRRTPPEGVLGRATYADADMWSCACAIQNLWLTARAAGLGVGWVTLFEPPMLASLVGAPPGVDTLGWLCIGWPDERPPDPGLERRGWSVRQPLEEVLFTERWPAYEPPAPVSHLAPPIQAAVVAARDTGDDLLTPTGSLGVLDRAIDKVLAVRPPGFDQGVLVLAAADHPIAAHGVSAYEPKVTAVVAEAALAGTSVGAVAASSVGLSIQVVDAGVDVPQRGAVHLRPIEPKGDLVSADGLAASDVERLLEGGMDLGRTAGAGGIVALGEIGVGNTSVAAALAAGLLGVDPDGLIGIGAGSDSTVVAAKRKAVSAALARVRTGLVPLEPRAALRALGGGELAVLTGVVLGAATSGAVVVMDGMATSVAALAALRMEPAVASHLIAGQRSREVGHGAVLRALGVEPLLDLRLRSGEGLGAVLAVGLLKSAFDVRRLSARTRP
ncbi:MAG: 5,6-dimethylbenzimidazole synthase [Acidimicrobiales bacterium]|nr:5,6-dimethylbenzimidazole synthase [Acidimicrobiales bacterium]